MQIEIKVTLTDDNVSVKKESTNRLAVATNLPGADPAVQKQDFLGQVENLVRTIAENQIPALYSAIEEATDEDGEEEETEAQASVREKLKAMRHKKEEDSEQNATDQLKEQV